MYHELRTYRATAPRMLEHLHRRMETQMADLFRENGAVPVGAWETAVGHQLPAYSYMLEWRDLTHREEGWAAFYADPRVAEMNARTLNDAGGELFHDYDVTLLKPAEYLNFTTPKGPTP